MAPRRWALWSARVVALLVLVLLVAIRVRYGGGSADFPDRSAASFLPADALERVVDLDTPPGNIAVSATGDVFFSLHPEAHPALRVAVLRGGVPTAFPNAAFQASRDDGPFFDTVLSLRIDSKGRLWTLDNANHGLGQPRLLAFDTTTGALVHQFDFPRELAGLGSHLNDFQVDPTGSTIYIADASIFGLSPALLVYDIEHRTCRRLLERDVSVQPEVFVPVVQGRTMQVLGLFSIRPGVDSIALDGVGERLYFAAVNAQQLYRVKTSDLRDEALAPALLGSRVEAFAPKTMSDGISMDLDGNIYLTDPEHSAIVRLGPDRKLTTLVKDERLRWPDGLSFGPDGWLYVTCSALHQVIGKLPSSVRGHAPYQIWRFRPGGHGVPGH